MQARHGTRVQVFVGLTIGLIGVAAGCSTKTPVELETSGAPVVQPADGGEGQNQAGVIEAGAIEIDTIPGAGSTSTTATPTTSTAPVESTSTTSTEPLSPEGQAMIDTMCKKDRRELRDAVDNYRADLGQAPTSEADLLASAYIRVRSDLFDVWADGSVVAQNATCANQK